MKKHFILTLSLLVLVGCGNTSSISSPIGESNSNTSINSQSSNESIQTSITSNNSVTSSSSTSSTSINSGSSSSNNTSVDIGDEETNATDLYAATYKNNTPTDYYESCRGLVGAELKAALHKIIKGHTTFGYSSTTSYYKTIDEDPYDSSKMYFIYTGVTDKSTSYNKEHVWAKSHGEFGTSAPAGSDLHNLHPCNSSLNSTRSSKDFQEGGTELTQYYGGNKTDSSGFEPSDFSKGDTARTIFYMAVRYEGDVSGEPDLELSGYGSSNTRYNDFSSGAKGVHGKFTDLYKWATSGQDPVDDYEVHRNNVIYSQYQHNRNPFIDHPEFIEMIYDKNYSGAGALNDKNPFETAPLSKEEQAEKFKSLVNAIPETINEAALSYIEKAEKYYAKMSDEAKALVTAEYATLQAKRAAYSEYADNLYVNQAIEAINAIGEVTLNSKALIEKAEALCANLSSAGLAKVTNYQVLLDARAKYDRLYQEYLDNLSSEKFEGNFSEMTGVTSSYGPVEGMLNGRKFVFSCAYKNNDFRLGSNKACSVSSEMKAVINSSVSDTASMLMDFEIERLHSITLNTAGLYGTVNNLYLIKTVDEGKTYTLIEQKVYDSKTDSYEFNIYEQTSGKYAIVIDGSTPRLILDSISID